ncbi:MAG: hypothetical protein IPP64_06165 [Bacteroidetes bacterium]|nr:hypothetical protein [Bacteroidota bacterium]
MEINNLPQSNSAFLENRFSPEHSRKNGIFADYFISSTQLLNQANNFIMILSPEGRIKSVSNSFTNLVGYTELEILTLQMEKLFAEGAFSVELLPRYYYFNSCIVTKEKHSKKIVWRLLPDVLINSYVFIGYLE